MKTKSRWYSARLMSVLLMTMASVFANDARAAIYWSELTGNGFGLIRSASMDGTGAQTLITQSPQSQPVNIAVDANGGFIFWSETHTDQIYRSTLDGQNVQSIITLGPPTPGIGEGYGLAVDPISQRLYYTNAGHDNRIFSANLDGSNTQTVLTLSGQDPANLALDLVHNKLYFSDGIQGSIERVNLDGTGAVDLLATGVGGGGLAIDPMGGKVYYTDNSNNTVNQMNLDGTNQITLLSTGGGSFPVGVALDAAAGKLYWTEANGRQIRRANLDGSNVEQLYIAPDSNLYGIAVVPELNAA